MRWWQVAVTVLVLLSCLPSSRCLLAVRGVGYGSQWGEVALFQAGGASFKVVDNTDWRPSAHHGLLPHLSSYWEADGDVFLLMAYQEEGDAGGDLTLQCWSASQDSADLSLSLSHSLLLRLPASFSVTEFSKILFDAASAGHIITVQNGNLKTTLAWLQVGPQADGSFGGYKCGSPGEESCPAPQTAQILITEVASGPGGIVGWVVDPVRGLVYYGEGGAGIDFVTALAINSQTCRETGGCQAMDYGDAFVDRAPLPAHSYGDVLAGFSVSFTTDVLCALYLDTATERTFLYVMDLVDTFDEVAIAVAQASRLPSYCRMPAVTVGEAEQSFYLACNYRLIGVDLSVVGETHVSITMTQVAVPEFLAASSSLPVPDEPEFVPTDVPLLVFIENSDVALQSSWLLDVLDPSLVSPGGPLPMADRNSLVTWNACSAIDHTGRRVYSVDRDAPILRVVSLETDLSMEWDEEEVPFLYSGGNPVFWATSPLFGNLGVFVERDGEDDEAHRVVDVLLFAALSTLLPNANLVSSMESPTINGEAMRPHGVVILTGLYCILWSGSDETAGVGDRTSYLLLYTSGTTESVAARCAIESPDNVLSDNWNVADVAAWHEDSVIGWLIDWQAGDAWLFQVNNGMEAVSIVALPLPGSLFSFTSSSSGEQEAAASVLVVGDSVYIQFLGKLLTYSMVTEEMSVSMSSSSDAPCVVEVVVTPRPASASPAPSPSVSRSRSPSASPSPSRSTTTSVRPTQSPGPSSSTSGAASDSQITSGSSVETSMAQSPDSPGSNHPHYGSEEGSAGAPNGMMITFAAVLVASVIFWVAVVCLSVLLCCLVWKLCLRSRMSRPTYVDENTGAMQTEMEVFSIEDEEDDGDGVIDLSSSRSGGMTILPEQNNSLNDDGQLSISTE